MEEQQISMFNRCGIMMTEGRERISNATAQPIKHAGTEPCPAAAALLQLIPVLSNPNNTIKA